MKRVGYFFLYFSLIVVALFQIIPLIWLFIFSLKDNREIFDCTVGGKLTIFPKLDLSEALKIMKRR